VVAVRVLQLRLAWEAQPEALAEQVATVAEVERVRRLAQPGKERGAGSRRGRLSVRQFVEGVARLGG
jgi:hypothetical protein